jgi:hypothetical protein
MQEFRGLVVAAPDLAVHHVVRWRCVDLRDEVARRFGVTVQERAIGKWLRKMGLTRQQPRPDHPKKRTPKPRRLLKKLQFVAEGGLGAYDHPGPDRSLVPGWRSYRVARVGQQGNHAYIGAPVGARPLMGRDNRHDSAYIFGAICPQRAVGTAMLTPAANTEMMNLQLAEISTQGAPGAFAVLLCDRAGWH